MPSMLTALINYRSTLQVDIASRAIPTTMIKAARARLATLDRQINTELSYITEHPEYVPSESEEEHHQRTCPRAQLAKQQGHIARRLSFDLDDWEQTCAAMIRERDDMIKDIDDWWPEPSNA